MNNQYTSLENSAVSNDVPFQTLVSFCAFNGCDFESSFVAKGRGAVSNLLMKSVVFCKTFKCIGNSCNVREEGVKPSVFEVSFLDTFASCYWRWKQITM